MLRRDEIVPSPCIGVCEYDGARGYCRGCFRTLAEIDHWPQKSAAERAAILQAIVARRAAATVK